MKRALQIVAGVVLGLFVAWALLQVLPIESGLGVVATSAAITLVLAVVVAARFRVVKPGAIAFAAAATAVNLLVGLIVAT